MKPERRIADSNLFLIVGLLSGLVVSCASKPGVDRGLSSESLNTPVRYLAWVEGDVQTDYKPNRELSSKALTEMEKNPPKKSDTDRYLQYLSLLSASGKGKKVERLLRDYLSEFPKESRAEFLLACHYWRARKRDLARYFFTKLEKNSSFPWKSLLFNNLGMIALGERDRRLALDYFRKATKAKPPVAAPYVNLGALYLQSLSYPQAEKVFEMAYNIDKGFEDAVVGLGSSLEGLGKFADAHKAYDGFLRDHPDALTVLYNDAIILGKRLNRKAEASQLMLRYIQRGGKASAKAQELVQTWR